MQGRLSPLVDGKIQAFPKQYWKDEFGLAEKNDFRHMEWTLDQDGLYQNPLMTPDGQQEIMDLCRRHKLGIPSLTGDCFMQAPFWKAQGEERQALENDFIAISSACAKVGTGMIVVPLVDNGRIENTKQEDDLLGFLQGKSAFFSGHGIKIVFESDFEPQALRRFIDRFDPELFGINYDIGNSAALGFSPEEELDAYGTRIFNVHVKDRVLGGTTVPLGEGNADFDRVFSALAKTGYRGNYILQTARSGNDDHEGVLRRYRDMTIGWMGKHGA